MSNARRKQIEEADERARIDSFRLKANAAVAAYTRALEAQANRAGSYERTIRFAEELFRYGARILERGPGHRAAAEAAYAAGDAVVARAADSLQLDRSSPAGSEA